MKHPFDKVLLTSTVNELSSKQKFWFASSIAGMVGADGHAHREELDFLKKAINFLDSEEQIQEIISMVKNLKKGFSPPLGKLTLEPRQAFFIIKYLAQIMVSDVDLSPKEIKYFLKIGSFLEYNTYYEEDKFSNFGST